MANWGATTQSSTFDANASAQSAMDARSGQRSSASIAMTEGVPAKTFGPFSWGGQEPQSMQSLSGYSIVGMQADKVPAMREQIRNSVSAIQAYLDGVDTYVQSDNAFKSEEIKGAVQSYVLSVKDYSKALISNLLAFSDKLQDVYNAWIASTQSFASESIEPTTGAMNDAATYYTEQL